MLHQELFDQLRLVGGKVVQDDVDLALGRLRGDDFVQERNKLLAGVPRRRLPDDFSGLRIQRCIK